MVLKSSSGIAGALPLTSDRRATDSVVTWLQIAHDMPPSGSTDGKAWASLLSGCAFVDSGTIVTTPKSVAFADKITTGRIFQNSGKSASWGKSHQ